MSEDERMELIMERARADLRQGRKPEDIFGDFRRMMPADPLIDSAEERLKEEQSRIRTMRIPRTLSGVPGEPWYTGPTEDDRFWWDYRERLEQVHRLPESAVEGIDASTTRTLGLMPPPGVGVFNSRGLVLGYVQSGKTANYLGLIAKAAEAGYRFFIVMTGLIEVLRQQTQKRAYNDLVGLDNSAWIQLTGENEDFGAKWNVNTFLDPSFPKRSIAIVKKDHRILDKLGNWLSGARGSVLEQCPTLIIDDEADQASINTASEDLRTTTNRRILGILEQLPKVAYVGYTATPFANILVDPSVPKDLYPRDFIVELPRPEGYLGPEEVFGREPLDQDEAEEGVDGRDMIRFIPEKEAQLLQSGAPGNDGAPAPDELSALVRAVYYFWLAVAARRERGHSGFHSTMLVHTSRLVADHEALRPVIGEIVARSRKAFRDGKCIDSGLRAELEALWNDEADRVAEAREAGSEIYFGDLELHLEEILGQCRVVCENEKSPDRLDYSEGGSTTIVIGGNILSRGLTLEGLVVSWFTRTASAYDTLLQMGRWFGFRKGYEDLPRIWMTEELEEYFRDLATVEEELRQDARRYEEEGITPSEFAVRIRRHPVLNITSPAKMKDAEEVERSYEGRRVQTILFHHQDFDWLHGNLETSRRLLRAASEGAGPERSDHGWILRDVDHSRILEFLKEYRFHENSRDLDRDLLQRYIRSTVQETGRLQRWNVVVLERGRWDEQLGTLDLGLPEEVNLINRAREEYSPAAGTASIKALMSRSDVVADRPEDYREARRSAQGNRAEELIERRSRENPEHGLLLLYPISRASRPRDPESRRQPLNASEDVIGAGLVFPSSLGGRDSYQKGRYMAAALRPGDADILHDFEDES